MDLAYEMKTRTGRSFWEVTSAMQNAIRKGDYEVAGYCAWELIPQYTPYLQKRLLVISAEDCFGVITKEILALTKYGTETDLTRALALMCKAKKNRDADYFVCNLMFPGEPTEQKKEELGKRLYFAIRGRKIKETGQISAELFQKNRKYLWKTLREMAEAHHPELSGEFGALAEANERVTKPTEETIFAAKGIVLLWTVKQPKEAILGYPAMRYDAALAEGDLPAIKSLEECRRIQGNFPDWAYNWHTTYGKYKLRRDAVHAIMNDQQLLTPLEENLFDDCTWNRDLNACLQKWNPRKYRLPYDDGKIDPEVKYGTQE